jgi:FtsH-binding integral membrane protein
MKNFTGFASTTKTSTYDTGLRNYMNGVYKNMSFALAITALVSFIFGNTQLINLIITPPLNLIVMFAPLIFVIVFSAKINKLTGEQARNYLMIFASIMGLSLSSIFIVYTGTNIVRTFLVTSATFGTMSIYGYTTKKDLTGMGSFLIMGLFGLIIASIVNLFLRSPGMEFALSLLGVLIFTGLTAYDVQKIKRLYFTVSGSREAIEKVAIMGALTLYLDFINLFLFLLRFMGGGRSD